MHDMFTEISAWEAQRVGKFTSSEIHKLFQAGRSKDEYFGKGAMTYIYERVAENLTQESCRRSLDGMAAIEWGNSMEIEAMTVIEDNLGIALTHYGKANPKFFSYGDYSGGSPDAASDFTCFEIKCPFNPANHVAYLMCGDQETMKQEHKDHYHQLMMNMVLTGKDGGIFVSYDPRFYDEKLRLHMINFSMTDEYKNELKERITEAEKLMLTTIGILQNN